MNVEIKVIPHAQQRYETCGDWWFAPDGTLHIRVSEMEKDDYEFLVAIHELVEAWVCRDRGVNENSITQFDKEYEDERVAGDDSEPGDSLFSPYKYEHCLATGIERILCSILNVPWIRYSDAILSLSQVPPSPPPTRPAPPSLDTHE